MQLRATLPPTLASQLDFSTLEPLTGSFVDEQMRGTHDETTLERYIERVLTATSVDGVLGD